MENKLVNRFIVISCLLLGGGFASCTEEVDSPHIVTSAGAYISVVEGNEKAVSIQLSEELLLDGFELDAGKSVKRLFDILQLEDAGDGSWTLRLLPYCGHGANSMIPVKINALPKGIASPIVLKVFVKPDLSGSCVQFFCAQSEMIGVASMTYDGRDACGKADDELKELALLDFRGQCQVFCENLGCQMKMGSFVPPPVTGGCVAQNFRDHLFSGFARTATHMCRCVKMETMTPDPR